MKTKTTEAQITLSPHGTARKTLPLSHVQIPDLWHLGQSMPELSEMVLIVRECGYAIDHSLVDDSANDPDDKPFTEQRVENAVNKALMYHPLINTKGAKAQENILTAWHTAIDLLRRAQALGAALQPILDLLIEEIDSDSTRPGHQGPCKVCGGAHPGGKHRAPGEASENSITAIAVPRELLQKVMEIHTGEVTAQ